MADGVNGRFDFTAPVPRLAELGAVHLIAIGGTGMSAVARLLLGRGIRVSGSDAKDSPVLASLAAQGATVRVGHDPAALDGADTVVVSSAIREDNVELTAARARGLRVLHRAQALAACLEGSRSVAVAGANGKTTTTSMTAVGLDAAGLDPSFASGGELPVWDTNARVGSGPAFVLEADESDGSFVTYHPDIAVVTNVQPDHLDFYGTFEHVRSAYAAFAASMRPRGLLIACADDEGSAALARSHSAAGGRVLTYGFAVDSAVRLSDAVDATLDADGFGASARVSFDGASRDLRLAVPGHHNLLDAAAAFAACVAGFGADPAAVTSGLRHFAGARRRFEVIGRRGGVTVIDDYAHNPGKVRAVVSTVVGLVGREHVHVVFQPHLYSRTRDFADGFAAGLAPAADVVLLPIYGAREEPMPGVTSGLVVAALNRLGGPDHAVAVAGPDEAVASVVGRARPGDVILTVGAGDVTACAPRILDALGHRR